MRYSLVSRFRGTLLGALVGQNLPNSSKMDASVDWVEMASKGVHSLMENGRFSLDNWSAQKQESADLKPKNIILSEAILTTLPLALFFHENTVNLRQSLLQVVEIWSNDPLVRDGTLVVGYAIALALTEKLNAATLIEQAVSFVGETSTNLPQQLLKVNNLLTQKAGLERVQAELISPQLHSGTIAMGFYCFMSTLEDFRLSVRRAHQFGVSGITGALSGAYNSAAGIPVTWQVFNQTNTVEQLTGFNQMLKLADELETLWSGVYDLTDNLNSSSALSNFVAAPRVIR